MLHQLVFVNLARTLVDTEGRGAAFFFEASSIINYIKGAVDNGSGANSRGTNLARRRRGELEIGAGLNGQSDIFLVDSLVGARCAMSRENLSLCEHIGCVA